MYFQHSFRRFFPTAFVALFLTASFAKADNNTLKVYLMAGQSNMTGQAPSFKYGDDTWGVNGMTSLEYLVLDDDGYRSALDTNVFSSMSQINASWLQPRSDVWAEHIDSSSNWQKHPLRFQDGYQWEVTSMPSPASLRPGFGFDQKIRITQPDGSRPYFYLSMIGPEMGAGHNLGNAMQSPVFLFKSDKGGTNLPTNWRPPSTVARDGGSVGGNYTNTVNRFNAFLASLDTDLADDGRLNEYGNATGYEVCGLVWMQGWNDRNTDQAVYQQALIDLVRDVRTDTGQAGLPAIIVESADRDTELNAARQAAVDALNTEMPGSAVFVETGDIGAITQHYHFGGRAEAYVEIGWRIGDAILENGYTGTEIVPEPATLTLLGLGGLMWVRRRRA